jgi:hypothetical protein
VAHPRLASLSMASYFGRCLTALALLFVHVDDVEAPSEGELLDLRKLVLDCLLVRGDAEVDRAALAHDPRTIGEFRIKGWALISTFLREDGLSRRLRRSVHP